MKNIQVNLIFLARLYISLQWSRENRLRVCCWPLQQKRQTEDGMPKNKNAMTRYQILDELLSNRYHNYSSRNKHVLFIVWLQTEVKDLSCLWGYIYGFSYLCIKHNEFVWRIWIESKEHWLMLVKLALGFWSIREGYRNHIKWCTALHRPIFKH